MNPVGEKDSTEAAVVIWLYIKSEHWQTTYWYYLKRKVPAETLAEGTLL